MNEHKDEIQPELLAEKLEKWWESWQYSMLSIKLQRQLLIQRVLNISLLVATIALMLATWYKTRSC